MNKQLFKSGDKVYYPLMSNKILTLKEHDENRVSVSLGAYGYDVFNLRGKKFEHHMTQSIFHANQTNYEHLSETYPHIKFEKPERLSPNEIVKQMFDDGYAYVLCVVTTKNSITMDIIREYDGDMFFGEFDNYDNVELLPIEPDTGKNIVDYVDGKPVLGD